MFNLTALGLALLVAYLGRRAIKNIMVAAQKEAAEGERGRR